MKTSEKRIAWWVQRRRNVHVRRNRATYTCTSMLLLCHLLHDCTMYMYVYSHVPCATWCTGQPAMSDTANHASKRITLGKWPDYALAGARDKTAIYAYKLHQKTDEKRTPTIVMMTVDWELCGSTNVQDNNITEEYQIHKQTLNLWEISYRGC